MCSHAGYDESALRRALPAHPLPRGEAAALEIFGHRRGRQLQLLKQDAADLQAGAGRDRQEGAGRGRRKQREAGGSNEARAKQAWKGKERQTPFLLENLGETEEIEGS